MKRQRKQPVDSQVLAFWRGRSRLLGRMLNDAPTAEQSWFWKIQGNIVNYLLDRYGDNNALEPSVGAPTESAALLATPALNPTTIAVRPSSSAIADVGEGKLPGASERIRPVLREIAGGNQDRYEMIQWLYEEEKERLRIEYQRMLDALPRSEPAEMSARKLIEDRPPAEARLLNWTSQAMRAGATVDLRFETGPEMAGMTDDEIAGILSGEIVVESIPEDILGEAEQVDDTRDDSDTAN